MNAQPLLTLIPEETALLVVDMQNGFIRSEGSIGRSGANMSLQQATVEPVAKLIEACRAKGITDIWTIQEHYPDDVTRGKHRIAPHTVKRSTGAPALVNTWDSEVIDELKPWFGPEAEVVRKHRFSAFFDTRLDTLLRMKGIRMLIVCGVSTTLCVETSVRDAYQRDYDVIVARDAVGISNAELHFNSLKAIETYFGLCLDTEEVLGLIERSVPGAPAV
jgi:Amidases related to nicotinamidase